MLRSDFTLNESIIKIIWDRVIVGKNWLLTFLHESSHEADKTFLSYRSSTFGINKNKTYEKRIGPQEHKKISL